MMQKHGVAIRIGLGDAAGAKRPAGAADVLDDDLLTEILGHGFSHKTRDGIGRATGRERHDHGDRAFGIGLCIGGNGEKRQGGNSAEQGIQGFHLFLPDEISASRQGFLPRRFWVPPFANAIVEQTTA
ncbi:hypothetical protein D9M72_551830 [compost metagenome]